MSGPTECQHVSCTDPSETTLLLDDGEYHLCEDHANMDVDGGPVDGYEPNDPEKLST